MEILKKFNLVNCFKEFKNKDKEYLLFKGKNIINYTEKPITFIINNNKYTIEPLAKFKIKINVEPIFKKIIKRIGHIIENQLPIYEIEVIWENTPSYVKDRIYLIDTFEALSLISHKEIDYIYFPVDPIFNTSNNLLGYRGIAKFKSFR